MEKNDFTPVFLVGFPKSGTTLLSRILQADSKIEVMEERPATHMAKNFLQKNGYTDLAFKKVPIDLLEEAKKTYRYEFYKNIKKFNGDSIYVHKLPLNLLQAPLIKQLYPQAKYTVAASSI